MDADLVLEGGGVKGIGLVGASTALEEAGSTFHRIAGTSAGAIVGALIAAGTSRAELQRVMREIDCGRFEDRGRPGDTRPHDLRRHVRRAGDRLRDRRDDPGHAVPGRTHGGDGLPGGWDFQRCVEEFRTRVVDLPERADPSA